MILFIDDEKMFNESYVEALEGQGYDVRFEPNVAPALDFFRENMGEGDIVILDIMFATPNSLPEGVDKSNTVDGLRTGEEVLRLMNSTPRGRKVAKIILTNVAADDFHTKYGSSGDVQACLRKRDTLPSRLVEIVKSILRR